VLRRCRLGGMGRRGCLGVAAPSFRAVGGELGAAVAFTDGSAELLP
jgi:hypothetical protein